MSQSTLYSTPGKCRFDVTEPFVIYNMIINRRHHKGELLEVSLVRPIVLSLLLFIGVSNSPTPPFMANEMTLVLLLCMIYWMLSLGRL